MSSRYFKCPNCGGIHRKVDTYYDMAQMGNVVQGQNLCADCQTMLSAGDVYSGRYDVPMRDVLSGKYGQSVVDGLLVAMMDDKITLSMEERMILGDIVAEEQAAKKRPLANYTTLSDSTTSRPSTDTSTPQQPLLDRLPRWVWITIGVIIVAYMLLNNLSSPGGALNPYTPTPTPTLTLTATATPTATPSPTPTQTPVPDTAFLRAITGHTGAINAAVFSPDGQSILSGAYDGTARLWDIETGEELYKFVKFTRNNNSRVMVDISSSGQYALSSVGGDLGHLFLWSLRTGSLQQEFNNSWEHTEIITSVALSDTGSYAISGACDHTMKLWNVSTGEMLNTFGGEVGHINCVSGVAFSHDNRYILSGAYDNTLKLWALSGEFLRTFEGHTDKVRGVALSPDSLYALSGSDDGTMRLWEVDTGETVHIFNGHTEGVTSVAFSSDGRYALSGSNDDTMRLWEVDTGETVHIFEDRAANITSVAFSPDGRYALAGSTDTSIRLYDLSGLIETE